VEASARLFEGAERPRCVALLSFAPVCDCVPPTMCQVRGLMRQHIDSFNHFVSVGLTNILKANDCIRSEVSYCRVVAQFRLRVRVVLTADNINVFTTPPRPTPSSF